MWATTLGEGEGGRWQGELQALFAAWRWKVSSAAGSVQIRLWDQPLDYVPTSSISALPQRKAENVQTSIV